MADNIKEVLAELEKIDGFIAAAIAHGESGMAMGTVGGHSGFNIEVAVAANSQVVKAKAKAMKALNLDGGIEDILITLRDQYHIIRPLKKNPIIFMYIALDRSKSNLAMARFQVASLEEKLAL